MSLVELDFAFRTFMQVVLVERGPGSLQFKPAAQQRPQTEAWIGDPFTDKGAVPHLKALSHVEPLGG